MREALKRLTGESLVYGLGQVSGRAVQLLLVPVLTRALLTDQYGVSETILAYSQTALLVLVFGMDAALARFFYQEPDREARVRMTSTSLAFRLIGRPGRTRRWNCSTTTRFRTRTAAISTIPQSAISRSVVSRSKAT